MAVAPKPSYVVEVCVTQPFDAAHLIEPSNLPNTKLFTYLFIAPQGVNDNERTSGGRRENVCRQCDYTNNIVGQHDFAICKFSPKKKTAIFAFQKP